MEWPKYVTVHYADANGNAVASDTMAAIYEGTNAVQAQPYDLQPNYVAAEEGKTEIVIADSNGDLDKSEVVFVYNYVAPVEWPKYVTVHYRAEDGTEVAGDTLAAVYEGTNTIYASPVALPENYAPLNENDSETVTALSDGTLDKNEITFIYIYEEPVPAVEWPVYITVRYMSADGTVQVAGDTLYALYEGANEVRPTPNDLLPDYVPDDENAYELVMVDEFGNPDQELITFYYHYNAPVQKVEWPKYVTVQYYNEEDGIRIADDTQQAVYAGENTVYPAPVNLPENYYSTNESLTVIGYEDGTLSQNVVMFTYYYEAPEAVVTPEPVVLPQTVTVRYMTMNGNEIATAQSVLCEAGETLIPCAPDTLPEGYRCLDDAPVAVFVDANGASTYTVTFYYEAIETPAPVTEVPVTPTPAPVTDAPVTATPLPPYLTVKVRYVNLDTGIDFYTTAAMCTVGAGSVISVEQDKVPVGYEVKGESTVVVNITNDGVISPNEVVFYFSAKTGTISVYYKAEDGTDIAKPQLKICEQGSNVITAAPEDLLDGYELDNSKNGMTATVTMSGDTLTPEYVIFWYKPIVIATETPAPVYDAQPMDTYARPKSDTINFRATPTTEDANNKIGIVTREDVAHVMGKVTTGSNEIWYLVEVNGVVGYLKENVVSLLSDAEIDAYLGITPTPMPATPTPVPVVTPDISGGIYTWGYTTVNSLNLRQTPSKNGKVVQQVDKNRKVWVMDASEEEDGIWYHVLYNSKEAYVLSKYVQLYSYSESEAIQNSLKSPAPTMPSVTAVVTIAPTYTPVPTPFVQETENVTVPPVIATETPQPYQGYALTVQRTALRSYTDTGDSGIITILDDSTLMLIVEQVWQDGELWDSVDAPATGYEGYIQDRYLRHIGNDEARFYLDRINNMATATPTITTPTPAPYTGYYTTKGVVALRSFASDTAYIQTMLTENTACFVVEQNYSGGEAWNAVQVADMYGYIRADQLRPMTSTEIEMYLSSLRTATPAIVIATPVPVTEESDSSYGYINTNLVRLRRTAGTNGDVMNYLDQYEFVLVMGDTNVNGEKWYHVMADGKEGYVSGKYLTVLKVNEIEGFLNSPEYQSTQREENIQQTQNNIQSWEDFNVNNNGVLPGTVTVNATYVPFNPYTPTPLPEIIATAIPTVMPTETPFVATTPTPGQAFVNPTYADLPNSENKNEDNGSALGLVLGIGAVLMIGGGAGTYAYVMHSRNKRRRAAVRAQQARQTRSAAQTPQQRPAAPQQTAQQQSVYRNYAPQQGNAAPRPYAAPAQPQNPVVNPAANPAAPVNPYARPAQNTNAGGYQAPVSMPAQNPEGYPDTPVRHRGDRNK